MMESDDAPTELHDLQIQNLIDQLCDEFEDSWRQGMSPEISDFLQRTSPDLGETLFLELVQIDITYRSASGQKNTIDWYAERFPQFEGVLSQLPTHETSTQSIDLGDLRELGSLKLLQKVGTGTFGVVWKAWDSQLEREVAVKLPTERSLGREYADEFRREAKAAAKLNHPGIVRVIDFNTHDGFAYIVYEFIEGLTLHQWMKKNTITPQIAAEFCVQIADALAHAHEQGVIHRDLKPGNILINRVGKPLITDFGLAKRTDSSSTIAGSGVVVGTLAYMSPEQAEGKSSEIDARSDIYSLGAILYELLAGRPVFQGDPRQILQKILFEPAPSLLTHATGVHRDLWTICHLCLEKEKSDRYSTAAEAAVDLRRFGNSERILAHPVPRTKRIARFVLVHWKGIATAFSALLIVVAVLATFGPQNQVRSDAGKHGSTEKRSNVESQELDSEAAEKIFRVLVQTNPPGARVSIVPRDPATEELDFLRVQGTIEFTPTSFDLTPGLYQVRVFLPDEPGRSHEVIRTVPKAGVTIPSGVGKPFEFLLEGDELSWPIIEIPTADVTEGMVRFEGDPAFPVGDPSSGSTVEIFPFYVSPRRFSYGDFLKLHPGEAGDVPNRPAKEQPPLETMPQSFERAAHWAEESGGRLMSEFEYDYLAALARAAQDLRSDEIPHEESILVSKDERKVKGTMPAMNPLFDILSGHAEWTNSLPHHPPEWPNPQFKNLENYRVFRRELHGTDLSVKNDNSKARSWAPLNELLPNVGFRITRPAR